MNEKDQMQFTDETIHKLFGHEAAENENIARLKDYYFKNNMYESIVSDIPLRILVGHKGIGKSALFTVGMAEDADRGRVAVMIRPDDVTEIETKQADFLKSIRNWKIGLERIIAHKVLELIRISYNDKDLLKGNLLTSIVGFFKPMLDNKVDLSPAQKRIVETYLKTRQIRVYIDDLDRGWKADMESISRLSALLNALRDMTRTHEGLQFKVALRSDVYFLVRTSDESTDKIEGSVVWHSWNNHEILAMLVKRVESFFGRPKTEKQLLSLRQNDLARMLDPVMEPRFKGRGHWANCPTYRILMSLIRKRPRDLVKLCTLAAHHAREEGRNMILTSDFDAKFIDYSTGRLQDTENEYKSELRDIQRLLLGMRPNRMQKQTREEYVFTTAKLIEKINKIMEQGSFCFYGGRIAKANDLAQFMYKINFLTARKEVEGKISRKYFEENKYIGTGHLDFGYDWEVHPAYRWALQPDNPRDVYDTLAELFD